LVRGRVWRFHVGGEVGWAHQVVSKLDLINVSDPSNVHSYGLALHNQSHDALILAPLAGVEWQVGNRWSVAFTPRAEVMISGVGRVGIVLPLSVAYSWFLL
jgi:hypothetical protein